MSAATPTSAKPPSAGRIDWRALPKVLLHEHLDGGLRPQTLWAFCVERGLPTPASDADGLARWLSANANSGSLERYLEGFDLTVRAMASASACERVAFEAAEDAQDDGCVLAEFRMAPLLLEPHGLSPEAAIEALLAGLQRSTLPCGLIVCAMRTSSAEDSVRAVQLALRYRSQGVIGFDLAGAERGFPPSLHREALAIARAEGLPITCHAGEADDGSRVLEAAALGARRIGHGVRVTSVPGHPADPHWLEQARASGLHFEVCPTSNVHTGVVPSIEQHPIRRLLEAGLSVSCSTDNRLMSAITLSAELQALHEQLGMSLEQLHALMTHGARASFLSASTRNDALTRIDAGFRDAASALA